MLIHTSIFEHATIEYATTEAARAFSVNVVAADECGGDLSAFLLRTYFLDHPHMFPDPYRRPAI